MDSSILSLLTTSNADNVLSFDIEMSTLQKQFEEMAKAIMDKAMPTIKHGVSASYRMAALKQMQAELMQLKETYAGLIELPKEEFAEYDDAEQVYFQLKPIKA